MLNRLLRPLNPAWVAAVPARVAREGLGQRGRAQPGRRRGPEAYATVLGELEQLSAAKVSALTDSGFVLLKLAVTGLGVRLRPPSG